MINEIENLKTQVVKNENTIVELNTFVRNLVSLYENKKEPVLKTLQNEEIKNKEKVKINIKCRYWNKGYCRSKSLCLYLHPKVLCEK